jgi:hypothetical protein
MIGYEIFGLAKTKEAKLAKSSPFEILIERSHAPKA